MGLDQYLIDCKRGEEIDFDKPELAYWRKANMIHSWFVEHVQGGEDDCKAYEVTKEKLDLLLKTVKVALKAYKSNDVAKMEQVLPTQEGFFFGNTDYDEDYESDLQSTVKQLTKILKTFDFEGNCLYYQSSW